MYQGVINIYKEKGFTSFDVVAKLRGILKQKKIGHTGTLDPDAEGVLVVCLGKATKLCDVLIDKSKTYEATLRLGVVTDTEDMTGKILETRNVDVTEDLVREVMLSFLGEYEQIPPMYSAIKVNGKKLYELARQDIVIERTPRLVTIHSLEITNISLPEVQFKVSCSKGTYIRSLCRDIGEKLGCGGAMSKLLRSEVNASETGKVFDLSNALTLSQIENYVQNGEIDSYIIPIDELFPNLSKLSVVSNEANKMLQNGNILKRNDLQPKLQVIEDQSSYLIYDKEEHFVAIYKYDQKADAFKSDKMFI